VCLGKDRKIDSLGAICMACSVIKDWTLAGTEGASRSRVAAGGVLVGKTAAFQMVRL
jgi:hypothetical protein